MGLFDILLIFMRQAIHAPGHRKDPLSPLGERVRVRGHEIKIMERDWLALF